MTAERGGAQYLLGTKQLRGVAAEPVAAACAGWAGGVRFAGFWEGVLR